MSLGHENRNIDALYKNIAFNRARCNDRLKTTNKYPRIERKGTPITRKV